MKSTTVRLSNNTFDDLKYVSEQLNKHPSQIVRESLITFLKTHSKTQNPQEIAP